MGAGRPVVDVREAVEANYDGETEDQYRRQKLLARLDEQNHPTQYEHQNRQDQNPPRVVAERTPVDAVAEDLHQDDPGDHSRHYPEGHTACDIAHEEVYNPDREQAHYDRHETVDQVRMHSSPLSRGRGPGVFEAPGPMAC